MCRIRDWVSTISGTVNAKWGAYQPDEIMEVIDTVVNLCFSCLMDERCWRVFVIAHVDIVELSGYQNLWI